MFQHWHWLFPVVLMIVWIVASLLRGSEEERPRKRTRSLPGGQRPAQDEPARRGTSDIDRFLEEVNRRRRQAAERRPAAASRERPSGGIPTATIFPAPSRPQSPTRPQVEQPRAKPPLGRRVERIPLAEPVGIADVLPVAVAVQPSLRQSPPLASSMPAPMVQPAEAPAQAFADLFALLRAPESLRSAVMLREILGRPLCRRHGLP